MHITRQLLSCEKISLVRLAGLVWFVGVIVLLFKSSGIFIETVNIGAPFALTVTAVMSGLAIGAIKAKYLFIRLCRQNIKRIYALNSPKIWQFYRPRFFIFLFLMIAFGKYAYHISDTNCYLLLLLATLELSISTALLISIKCFWNKSDPKKDIPSS